jgi:hypothetical protein
MGRRGAASPLRRGPSKKTSFLSPFIFFFQRKERTASLSKIFDLGKERDIFDFWKEMV